MNTEANYNRPNFCPILYGEISEEKRESLLQGLKSLYNQTNLDTELGIHDFVLAENTLNYLITIGNMKAAELELSK